MNTTSAVVAKVMGNALSVKICGEIDHHTVRSARREIDAQIYATRPKKLVIDLSEMLFMDSSGLGLIVGRVASAKEVGATVELIEVSPRALRIFEMAGLFRAEGLTIHRTKGKED